MTHVTCSGSCMARHGRSTYIQRRFFPHISPDLQCVFSIFVNGIFAVSSYWPILVDAREGPDSILFVELFSLGV